MERNWYFPDRLHMNTMTKRWSHSRSSLESLFCILALHEEYPEYFWRVRIQALDWNLQRIWYLTFTKYPSLVFAVGFVVSFWFWVGLGFLWQGQERTSSSCDCSPAAVLLPVYNITHYILGQNDSLQEKLLLASKRKVYPNF